MANLVPIVIGIAGGALVLLIALFLLRRHVRAEKEALDGPIGQVPADEAHKPVKLCITVSELVMMPDDKEITSCTLQVYPRYTSDGRVADGDNIGVTVTTTTIKKGTTATNWPPILLHVACVTVVFKLFAGGACIGTALHRLDKPRFRHKPSVIDFYLFHHCTGRARIQVQKMGKTTRWHSSSTSTASSGSATSIMEYTQAPEEEEEEYDETWQTHTQTQLSPTWGTDTQMQTQLSPTWGTHTTQGHTWQPYNTYGYTTHAQTYR
eukprot:TRINITY_DN117650_c0_g1_i1.p1 TRINITY_DN117650_c0_g1~~TRINITY_DN117650_c0_g1_i1.p1  ORF type:complete len:265 (-),score=29.41 TRINITY_DN117650_c0_g1_i1:40-834(-)